MSLNQLYRAFRKLSKFAMNPVEYLKAHHEEKFSEPILIDLGDVRNNKEYKIYGDVLIVEDIDGTAYIRLNEKENSLLQLRIGRKIYQDFWRFYITNTAQTGKTLTLIAGREGCFDITETDYWLNLLKDKQDEAKLILDGVKAGTDKIIEGAATAVKQDLLKAVMDAVKAKTDGIIDQTLLATATLQNTMKDVMDTVYDKARATEILLKLPEQSREGLVLYLDLEKGIGTDAIDKSDRGNDGTISGASWTDGRFGKALSFNGVDNYINCGKPTSLNDLTTFTFIAWFNKTAGGDTYARIFDKGNIKTLYITDAGYISFRIKAATKDAVASKASAVSLDEWHFLAVTYDDKGDRKPYIFLNGVDIEPTQIAAEGDINSDVTENLNIGGLGTANSWKGIIDEIRIYNCSKGNDEIKAYNDYGSVIRYKERDASFETQKLFKSILEGVKEGTDKIIASGATEAKQDEILAKVELIDNKTGVNVTIIAGDALLLSDDEDETTTELTYQILKQMKIFNEGTYRIKFDLQKGGDDFDVCGRIYKNGEAYGTEHCTQSMAGVTYSEDLEVEANDLIQIYGKITNIAVTCHVHNFRLYGDYQASIGVVQEV